MAPADLQVHDRSLGRVATSGSRSAEAEEEPEHGYGNSGLSPSIHGGDGVSAGKA